MAQKQSRTHAEPACAGTGYKIGEKEDLVGAKLVPPSQTQVGKGSRLRKERLLAEDDRCTETFLEMDVPAHDAHKVSAITNYILQHYDIALKIFRLISKNKSISVYIVW